MLLEPVRPYIRCAQVKLKHWYAKSMAALPSRFDRCMAANRVAFIVGCGRSGTSLIGSLLAQHPQTVYLYEPYHYWAAIDPKNDAIHLFDRISADMFRTSSDGAEVARRRFGRLFLRHLAGSRKLLVEKTPYNALRLAYLQALAPGARVLHIIRDGVDVVRSINRIATQNQYKIAGKPNWNQWWGDESYRWKALARDGTAAGYFVEEIERLQSHRERAAYEWLVSLHEVDRQRSALGDRLFELTYDQLARRPRATLIAMCRFLHIEPDASWIEHAARRIRRAPSDSEPPLHLPEMMCRDFNRYQSQYGFAGRAVEARE
jgi:hypothetical protein